MFFARSLHIPKDQLRIIATLNEQVTVLSGESQASPWRMSKNPTTLDPSLDPFFIPQTLGDLRENWSHWTSHLFNPIIIELDDGKIYRKALYLMVKTMVSCRFSLKPIQWYYLSNHLAIINSWLDETHHHLPRRPTSMPARSAWKAGREALG